MTDAPRPVRLAVAEDHPALRESLLRRLDFFPEVEVVLVAPDGAALVAGLDSVSADVVLMDIEMPTLDGVAATDAVVQRWPATAVVMLTVFEDEARIAEALAAGAAGYLLKDEPAETIVAAVLSAARGGAPVSEGVASTLVRRVRTQETLKRDALRRLGGLALTAREREVFALLATGVSDDVIADRLFLSLHTVQSHTKSLFRKLGVHTRAAAVSAAAEYGVGAA
ncbi:MAG TPA: response regulator transcription factor [Rubricoccaceae bacterium]|jgi:DNA-binding NarL/FixJ family response regulator